VNFHQERVGSVSVRRSDGDVQVISKEVLCWEFDEFSDVLNGWLEKSKH